VVTRGIEAGFSSTTYKPLLTLLSLVSVAPFVVWLLAPERFQGLEDRMTVVPETFFVRPSKFAPNNNKPILIYRDCLPLPVGEEKAKEFLESHAWIQGGTWGHIKQRHFHPNTHECYGGYR
jgi:hypothetical protein